MEFVNSFKVALMTSVASKAFSLGDSSSAGRTDLDAFAAALRALGSRASERSFDSFVCLAVEPIEAVGVSKVLSLIVNKSERTVTVAGVQVDAEAIAVLTESARAREELMLAKKYSGKQKCYRSSLMIPKTYPKLTYSDHDVQSTYI